MTPQLGSRDLFPDLEPRVYLNHAAVSPLSTPVRAAALQVLDDVARLGMGAYGPWFERREVLRADIAAWLGVQPSDVGFPPGTTRGITDIALAIDWRPGERVLGFTGEFPSNVLPWRTATDGRVELLPLDGFDDGSGTGLARVEDALRRGKVRVVAVSAVQFSTGLRMPLSELGALAHAHGAELFVDGIQALGAQPLDLGPVDYLVAGTHKWLMGLDGLAVAYAAPSARAELRPKTAGWLSRTDAMGFLFEGPGHLRYDRPLKQSLDWMEGGVQTTAAFAGLHASVELLRALGTDAIAAHIQALHDALEPRLVALGLRSARASDPAARSGSLSLLPPAGVSVADLARGLAERGISASTPDGWLRLAPHWPNGMHEVDLVVEAVAEVLGA